MEVIERKAQLWDQHDGARVTFHRDIALFLTGALPSLYFAPAASG